jgi:CRP-like cAMP-binding protein
LWNVPRAATVTARVNSQCLSIDRQAFLIAVQSHAATFDVLINRSIALGVDPSRAFQRGRTRRGRH